ncbi:MAG: polymer-forming cytoskeletal protein [Gammaproteobacteria bacterium]
MFNKKKQPPIRSLVAQGTRINGDVTFSDGIRVDGEVVGDIRSEGSGGSLLVVSESAQVTGRIHADHVIINGTVMGPVMAAELLELQPKARIEGDVSYKALEMHQGATISGQLQPVRGEAADKPTLKLLASGG